jgi:predicted TIM-barrel fold metal-dependent hydrolase
MTTLIDPLEAYKHAVADTGPQPRRWSSAGAGEGVVMISNDSHVGPPIEEYRQYCPKDLLEDFDDFAPVSGKRTGFAGVDFRNFPDDLEAAFEVLKADPLIHYDPHVRLGHMDEDGVAAEVVYHGAQNRARIPFVAPGFLDAPWESGRRQTELAAAGLRMYNRWLADYCSVAPGRFLGLAYLPMWDVDLAVQEAEFGRNAGLRGINFPSPRPGLANYNDPLWDPLWSASASLVMPLNSHVGNTDAMLALSTYTGVGARQIFQLEAMHFSHRSIPFMILGGVFERHPGLKLIMTENAVAWAPDMVRDLDAVFMSERHAQPQLSRKPSEYFWSNVFIGASFISNSEARTAVADGSAGNVVWGRDYPHLEGTWPYTKYSVRFAMEGIPDDAVRQMLGLTAIDIFGLDRAEIKTVADKIGPSIDEIMTPLAPGELPEEARRFTTAFRPPGQGLV